MTIPTRICWAVLLLVHTIPALAFFSPALISELYGVDAGSQVFLLLHHRAALFLVICVICLWAIVRPEVRKLAVVAVGVSMTSFVLLYFSAGSPVGLRSIALVDLAGSPFLAFVGWQAFRRTH